MGDVVGKLKEGWKIYRFDQMAINVNERINDPSKANFDYYVGLEHLDSDSLKIRRWGTPSDVEATKLIFRKGDIIFGRRNAYLRRVAVADFDGICSAHAMVLRAREDVVLPGFLPFFMQTNQFWESALKISAGSMSPTINWKNLAKEEFALPPLEEQRRLLNLFYASIAAVDSLDVALSKVLRCLKAVREDYFSSKKCKEVQLKNLIYEIQAGKSLIGNESDTLSQANAVLKVSAVGKDCFLPEESKVLVNQHDFLPQFSVKAEDLLITRANTLELVGMSCLVNRDYPNLMLSDKTLRLVPKDGISKNLLLESLWTVNLRQQFQSIAAGTGAAMKNISQVKLQEIRILWPIIIEDSETFLSNIKLLRNSYASIRDRLDAAKNCHRKIINSALGIS